MKGLMIKDLRLLFNQKKTWIMYVLLCVMMGFSTQGAFMVGYTVMLCGVLGISTISYDQAENGMPFLFTLPIDRQSYVREKYLLCLMMEAAGAVFGLTVCEIISLIKTGILVSMDDIHSALIVIPVMLCLISFMIPINLKYGAEKARLVMMISYGIVGAVVALVAVLVQDILPSAGHSFFIKLKVFFDETLGATYFWTIPAVLAVIALGIMYLSYRISRKVITEKEF